MAPMARLLDRTAGQQSFRESRGTAGTACRLTYLRGQPPPRWVTEPRRVIRASLLVGLRTLLGRDGEACARPATAGRRTPANSVKSEAPQ